MHCKKLHVRLNGNVAGANLLSGLALSHDETISRPIRSCRRVETTQSCGINIVTFTSELKVSWVIFGHFEEETAPSNGYSGDGHLQTRQDIGNQNELRRSSTDDTGDFDHD